MGKEEQRRQPNQPNQPNQPMRSAAARRDKNPSTITTAKVTVRQLQTSERARARFSAEVANNNENASVDQIAAEFNDLTPEVKSTFTNTYGGSNEVFLQNLFQGHVHPDTRDRLFMEFGSALYETIVRDSIIESRLSTLDSFTKDMSIVNTWNKINRYRDGDEMKVDYEMKEDEEIQIEDKSELEGKLNNWWLQRRSSLIGLLARESNFRKDMRKIIRTKVEYRRKVAEEDERLVEDMNEL